MANINIKHPDEIVDERQSPDDGGSPFFSHYIQQIDDPKSFTGALHTTQMNEATTAILKKKFIELFALSCIAKDVAFQMKISLGTVYLWRKNDEKFCKEMDDTRRKYALSVLEDKAMNIVLNSKDPKDHPLLMFMMRSYGRRFFDDKFVEVDTKKNKLRIQIQRSQPKIQLTDEEIDSFLPNGEDGDDE